MKVRELVERLAMVDQEAEVHYPSESAFGSSVEINDLYETEVQYGLLVKPLPPRVKAIVLCTGSEDL